MASETANRRSHLDENGVHAGESDGEQQSSSGDRSDAEYSRDDSPPRRHSAAGLLVRSLVCVLAGFVFGFAIEKGRVFEPFNVRGQMVFKRLVYLKVTMASIAAGMFGLSLMAMIPSTYNKFQRVCIHFYSCLADKGIMACGLGGLIMGVGVSLAGACPLLVFVQIGAQLPNAVYTLLGGLAGALAYGLLSAALTTFTRPYFRSSTNPWMESNYFITALPLVAMFGMLVFAFELLIPWHSEVKKVKGEPSFLEMRSWQPMLCGIIVGLLQIPMVLGAELPLGGSQSYSTIVSQVFIGPLKRLSPYLAHCRYGFRNWSQVLYVFGIVLGGYVSASYSNSLGVVKGVPVNYAFIGGFLLTFGAQMAGGGTHTHGQTGMGLLSILSFITMTCLFASSIFTAIMMKRFGVISPSVKYEPDEVIGT